MTRATPGLDADFEDFMRYARTLTRGQRAALYFAATEAVFDDYRNDGAADQRWVAAAHRAYAQLCTLLIRAKGHTTMALQLDQALARDPAGPGSMVAH